MKSRSFGERLFDVINIGLMCIFCITIIFPLWDMIVVSLSPSGDISYLRLNLWPKNPTLEAYEFCMRNKTIFTAFFVSVGRTVVGTAYHIFLLSLAAYGLTKQDLPGKRIITTFYVIPMLFGGGIIPTFLWYKQMGFINNPLVYVIPAAFSTYSMLILRNFFLSIDSAMEEAALIDGASVLKTLLHIIMPLSKPALATIALWHMVYQWNSWFDSLIYIQDEKWIVLQLFLRRLMDQTELLGSEMASFAQSREGAGLFSPDTVKAAVTVIVITPIICVYPFLQKYVVKGIMIGAVKG